jgi:hypothetical protein
MPRGGVQSSLVGVVNTMMAPFRRQQGKGAPVYSYASTQNGGGTIGDITQFAPVFQPSGGLFAPGYPMAPVDYERTRRYNFPVGLNYIYTPRSYEPIGFAELKALASDDITRLCIETRKDQIEKLGWTIKPRDEEDVAANADQRIKQLTEFWSFPDGLTPFATWLRALIEQVLVIDAPALEPRLNRGGDIGLDVIDGATIKVLIDDTGRRPRPPAPAYEQIIHGRPWVLLEDGTRANTEEGEVYNQFTDQQLIYFPRNPRADHLYGFAPVEQIVLTINTSIRRGVMQLQHFTIGNIPAGMVNAPDGWTGEQIARFQEWFDSKLAGNTAERTKLLWGPQGAKYQSIKEPPLKDDFDEWRARVICFAFSLPPTAFTRQVNRATAETAQEAALEEGLAPLMGWVKRLVDQVIQRRQGHPDLEFAWSDVKPIDPADQASMLVNLTGAGVYTLNEARDQLGMDPVKGGDEIMFKTGTGPITLDNVLHPPEPILPMGQPGQNSGAAPGGGNRPRAPGKPPGGKPAGKQPKGGVGKVASDPLRQAAGQPPQHSSAGPDQDPLADEARAFLRSARAGRGTATGQGAAASGLGEAVEPPPPWRLITGITTKAGWEDVPRDDHGRWTGGAVSLKETNQRAWSGKQEPNATRLSKNEAGQLGEEIAKTYVQSLGHGRENAKSLNEGRNNYPVDMVGDHELYEIKTGQVTNTQTAQQWRATIGEPGKTEKAWLKTASPEDKRAWNEQKANAIIGRKQAAVADYSKRIGQRIQGKTLTIILHPDKQIADIHVFDGFHTRIGYNSDQAKSGYVGSFRYANRTS